MRVLEYTDQPGDKTTPHEHPDSVIIALSTFQRRMYSMDAEPHDVTLTAGKAGWLSAQRHSGHNIGQTDSHALFVQLKEGGQAPGNALGPVGPVVD